MVDRPVMTNTVVESVTERIARWRAREESDRCEHCQLRPINEDVSAGGEDRSWCSDDCVDCCGSRCKHANERIGTLLREHEALGREVERLTAENEMLRGEVSGQTPERALEPVVAEMLAMDSRATKAPWAEKCGVAKHYIFSKDPGEDFGASLQEMHWQDGRIVPAHDNGSLIVHYRNHTPELARSWSGLWSRWKQVQERLRRVLMLFGNQPIVIRGASGADGTALGDLAVRDVLLDVFGVVPAEPG